MRAMLASHFRRISARITSCPRYGTINSASPDKNRTDNLQATHVDCNNVKGSYPSPWHRHTLRMCLAIVRGEALDTDSVLWKLAGEKPASSEHSDMVQGPEWVHLSSAYGLVVPYIHKYFNDQGLRVPPRIRSDQFT